jgi:hypothetical protein
VIITGVRGWGWDARLTNDCNGLVAEVVNIQRKCWGMDVCPHHPLSA